jgi:hypothetical protein
MAMAEKEPEVRRLEEARKPGPPDVRPDPALQNIFKKSHHSSDEKK